MKPGGWWLVPAAWSYADIGVFTIASADLLGYNQSTSESELSAHG
jgi:hypothetical protein